MHLGFLLFVKFGALQTALDAILGLVVMNLNSFGKVYGLINGYYFGERLLLFRISILTFTRRRLRRIMVFLLINPLKSLLSILVLHLTVLNDLAHLCVKESISYDHFFLLEVFLESFALERQVVKIE